MEPIILQLDEGQELIKIEDRPQDTGEETMTTMDKRNIEATILTAMERGEKKVWLRMLLELHRAGEHDFILNTLNKHWDKQKQRAAYREKIGTR